MCRADPTCGDPYIRDGQIYTLNEDQVDFESGFKTVRMKEKLKRNLDHFQLISPCKSYEELIYATLPSIPTPVGA